MFIQTLDSSQCKFGAYQKWKPAGRVGVLEVFCTFSLKAHYYPAYHIGADCSDWTVPTLWNSLHENVL